MKKSYIGIPLSVLGLFLASNVLATNGYFSHGYGTKNKGLAGGGVALPQDAMISATNPAGIVFVDNRYDVGLAVFSPSSRGYTAGTPGGGATFPLATQSVESENDSFLIPHFGISWPLSNDAAVGLALYGNGGMNTEYSAAANVFGGGKAGVNLEQLFVNTTYSRKISEKSSFGISAIYAYQRFKAEGLSAFGSFSSDSNNLTNRGYDTSSGIGFKFGVQSEFVDGLTIAASYQTRFKMSAFDKYRGLFAEQGDFDIPATWTVGLALEMTPSTIVTFDVQEIMYSDIASIANPLIPNLSSSQLGNADGAGFGWQDMTIYKLGLQWQASQKWTWRAGFSSADQPIPASENLFNILAPAVMEEHVTLGMTHSFSDKSELNVALMHALKKEAEGTNALGDGQSLKLEMTQWEIDVSWGYRF